MTWIDRKMIQCGEILRRSVTSGKVTIDRPTIMHKIIPFAISAAMLLLGCGNSTGQYAAKEKATDPSEQDMPSKNPYYSISDTDKLDVSLEEWKKILPPELYHVAFEKGTERPFTGKFEGAHKDGVYRCAVCGYALFDPHTKFDSGTGWPSFYQPLSGKNVLDQTDRSAGMVRDEVVCARCGAHLGHVFEDGPAPTGLRYCINAVSLDLD